VAWDFKSVGCTAGAIAAGFLAWGAAHVTAYLDGLAVASEVDRVVLGDPDGAWVEEAEERLGDKLPPSTPTTRSCSSLRTR